MVTLEYFEWRKWYQNKTELQFKWKEWGNRGDVLWSSDGLRARRYGKFGECGQSEVWPHTSTLPALIFILINFFFCDSIKRPWRKINNECLYKVRKILSHYCTTVKYDWKKNQFFLSVARARLNLVIMKRNSRAYQTYLTCDVAITQIQEPFTACFWYTLMLIVFMDREKAPLE